MPMAPVNAYNSSLLKRVGRLGDLRAIIKTPAVQADAGEGEQALAGVGCAGQSVRAAAEAMIYWAAVGTKNWRTDKRAWLSAPVGPTIKERL